MKYSWQSWYFEFEMQLKTEPEILSTWYDRGGKNIRNKIQSKMNSCETVCCEEASI